MTPGLRDSSLFSQHDRVGGGTCSGEVPTVSINPYVYMLSTMPK